MTKFRIYTFARVERAAKRAQKLGRNPASVYRSALLAVLGRGEYAVPVQCKSLGRTS